MRIDPLDGLRKYDGGYNITNKHYWSVSYLPSLNTAVYTVFAENILNAYKNYYLYTRNDCFCSVS